MSTEIPNHTGGATNSVPVEAVGEKYKAEATSENANNGTTVPNIE